jgi:hypothetical protein
MREAFGMAAPVHIDPAQLHIDLGENGDALGLLDDLDRITAETKHHGRHAAGYAIGARLVFRQIMGRSKVVDDLPALPGKVGLRRSAEPPAGAVVIKDRPDPGKIGVRLGVGLGEGRASIDQSATGKDQNQGGEKISRSTH